MSSLSGRYEGETTMLVIHPMLTTDHARLQPGAASCDPSQR